MHIDAVGGAVALVIRADGTHSEVNAVRRGTKSFARVLWIFLLTFVLIAEAPDYNGGVIAITFHHIVHRNSVRAAPVFSTIIPVLIPAHHARCIEKIVDPRGVRVVTHSPDIRTQRAGSLDAEQLNAFGNCDSKSPDRVVVSKATEVERLPIQLKRGVDTPRRSPESSRN